MTASFLNTTAGHIWFIVILIIVIFYFFRIRRRLIVKKFQRIASECAKYSSSHFCWKSILLGIPVGTTIMIESTGIAFDARDKRKIRLTHDLYPQEIALNVHSVPSKLRPGTIILIGFFGLITKAPQTS